MKNVTISMDDELYAETRVEAAKAGMSMSRYIARKIRDAQHSGGDKRNLQREALERIFAGPGWSVTRNGRMPTADERNER